MKFLMLVLFAATAFANPVEEGRRMVKLAGCNDCHTPRYGEMNGEVPEKDWLTGVPVGFKGPWGTSYPSNLRTMVQTFKEKPFIKHVRTRKYLPPMPGYVFAAMTDKEIGAIYAYLKHLGPAGDKTPVNLPPNQNPKGPYIYFVPVVDK